MLRDGEASLKGLKEEETMAMLFGEEFESLFGNRFEGFKDECKIFADVFYGGRLQNESYSCGVSGASKHLRDSFWGSGRIAYPNLNLDNSNFLSNFSTKGLSGQVFELSNRMNYYQGDSQLPGALDQTNLERYCSFHYKSSQHHSHKNSEFVKLDFKGYQLVSHLIVESFAHGILSSYYSVNPVGSMDAASDNFNNAILSYRTPVQLIGDNQVIVESTCVTSPVSQESIASGFAKRGPNAELKENSGVTVWMDQIIPETLNQQLSELASKRVMSREMPDRLESYAHSLLTDAGWIIEPRVRKKRNKHAYLFRKSEEGLVRSSLSTAWKTCGERLFYTASESEKCDQGREWSNLKKFWADLKDTLAYIDTKIQQQGNKFSLLRRWQLLDPFLAVVFINRKIGVLRMGKLLRAVKSATFIPDCNEGVTDATVIEDHISKSRSLSNACKLVDNCSLSLSHTDYTNSCVYDSRSDLESEDPCGHAYKMLGENAIQQKTTNTQQMPAIYQQECQSFQEVDGFSFKEHAHELCMGSSSEISLHLEGSDVFLSKQISPENMLNGLLNNTHRKSKNISEVKETEVTGRKKRPGSEGKHRGSPTYDLNISNSDIPYFPSYEVSNTLTSECLNSSHCLKRQTCNVLSTSEDEISDISEIREANSTTKLHEDLTFGNKAAQKLDEHEKEISVMPIEVKTSITFSNLNEGQDDMLHKLTKFECNNELFSSDSHYIERYLGKPLPDSKEIQQQCINSMESFVTTYDVDISKTYCQESREEVFSAPEDLCPGSVKNHKVIKASESDDRKGSGLKRSRGFYINDDDLLIAAIIMKKDFTASCKKFSAIPKFFHPVEALRKSKSQKRGCSLIPGALGSGGKLSMDGKQFDMRARTVLCWLIDMGIVSLNDIIQFCNPKNHEVIKDGWVTRDGILCKCCSQCFSVSNFKAHAGCRQQKPPLNIYMQSGKSYTLCQLQAWSTEYKLRKRHVKVENVVEMDQNDDTCGICADGGELICCDNCPSTYHQSCLSAQELPEGSWYCSNCICKICNNLAFKNEESCPLAVFECSQCEHKYHRTCRVDKVAYCGEVESNIWFCGDDCKKVFFGLRSRVGIPIPLDDGLSWTILRCNHDDQNVYSLRKIALMAECNSKLAIALSLMEECFLPMVDPRTGIDMVPHVIFNWGSRFARLNYQGFYCVILEKDDALISVASVRVHTVKVAEIPLIATCGLQRRRGMCRRLMNAIEMMLRSFKVEIIVLSAIPSLVETWMSGFGFSLVEAEEKSLLAGINLMLLPGTILMKKKLKADLASAQAEGPFSTLSPLLTLVTSNIDDQMRFTDRGTSDFGGF